MDSRFSDLTLMCLRSNVWYTSFVDLLMAAYHDSVFDIFAKIYLAEEIYSIILAFLISEANFSIDPLG